MSHKFRIILGVAAAALVACQEAPEAEGDEAEIGEFLNDKVEVAIDDVPPAVLKAARDRRPDLQFTAAEKELRNGRVYFDVEGTDETGAEIELDIMQDGEAWTVVEIQRDIALEAAPEPVRKALARNAPGVAPDRVIESDQGDGVIIYEFFDRAANGEESKYEVKFDSETAVFLTEEWAH